MKKHAMIPMLAVALCAVADEPETAITGAELGAWTQDYAAATNAAAASGKPVFLDFTGSDWCGWCMLMERQVFSQQEWKDWAATNIYLVTIDFPQDKSKVPDDYKDRNRALSKDFGVGGYPTYVVLDSKGKNLGRLGASRNAKPAKFIRQLCGVLGIDPPAKPDAVPADPAAKRLVEGVSAALKAAEKEAKSFDTLTVAQFRAVNDRFASAVAGLDTKDAPADLLAAFRPFAASVRAMADEYGKLDQTKTFRELGRPPESLRNAMKAVGQALEKFGEAAEACGVEDASDLLDL